MYPWVQKGAAITKAGRKKFSQLKTDQIKRVLVIRHAALGDMIQTRPFLYELKKLFPNAEVVLSLTSQYQYAAPKDLVDSIHVVYGNNIKGKSLLEKYNNFKEVGEFDVLIDLACTARSHTLSFLTKAKLKMAFPYRNMNWLYDVCMFRSDLNFEALILLEFLYLFGSKPEFPLNYKLQVHNPSQARKKIAYFMGSSTLERNYPIEGYLKVVDSLATLYPDHEHVILQGLKPDEQYLDFYKKLSHHKNIKIQSAFSLEDLFQFMSEIRLLVANDTGVRHVALGTHTPTLSIYNTSIPYRNWPRYEHIHDCVLAKYDEHPSAEEVIECAKKLMTKVYP